MFARVREPEEPRDLALMVPTQGEGVDAREMAETMGVRGTDHGYIVFDRAPVPVADRFGEEGQGVEVALSGFLGPSRISLATSASASRSARSISRSTTPSAARRSVARSPSARRSRSGSRRWRPTSRPAAGW